MAKVSNPEELKEALSLESIEQIEVLDSITINEPIDKTILIPEDVSGINLDFQGNVVKELRVIGDNNTIKNATVVKLTIASTVNNLYLENIQDTDGSEYLFDGGGGESIKLLGNTTFKGNIRIISGTDVQITAESDEAKIEGTVSVESSAKTTISAPVTNLVIDTEDSDVVINAKVDKVAVRKDAKITLKQGVETPRIEARLGTTVTAKDENGEQVAVDVNYTLDIYELRLNISDATNRLNNIDEGQYDGNVAVGEKAKLQNALTEAELALQNNDITTENQKDIDEAAKTLGQAIADFDSKIVKVDRWEINQLVEDIYIFLNYSGIVIGTDVGNYPQEAYNEFKDVFDATRVFLRGNEVTQEGVEIRIEQLKNALATFNASKIITENTRGVARFLVKGDNIQDWTVISSGVLGKSVGSGEWKNLRNIIGDEAINVNDELGNLAVNVEINVLDKYNEYVIPMRINQNSYLAFLSITSEDIRNQNVKEISLDNFASIDISIEAEEPEEYNCYLYNLNAGGIYNILLGGNVKDVKIQPGKYSISCRLVETDIPYYLYTDPIELNGEDKEVIFGKDEFVKVEFRLNQKHPYNYTINKSLFEKYNTGDPVKIYNDNPLLYLRKGTYSAISPEYSMDINGKEYSFFIYGIKDIIVDENLILELSDDFGLKTWSNIAGTPVITNKEQALGEFGNLKIENDLEQRAVFNEDGHPDHSLDLKYLLKITVDGKEYERETFRYDLPNLTFAEIIGEDNLEGEFTLEVSIPELPIVKPYIQEMRFELAE